MRRTLSVLGASLLFCLATAGTAAANSYGGPLFSQLQSSSQSQSGSNSVSQDASSTAISAPLAQINVNAPIRVLSDGDDGSVTQSNDSSATSSASNESKAIQLIEQSQGSDQTQNGEQVVGCCGGGGSPSFEQSQDSSQAQDASNSIDQNASSKAVSAPGPQLNVNAPIRILSDGDNGSVTQSNSSSADSSASNTSWAVQGIGQEQSSTQTQDGQQSVACCDHGKPGHEGPKGKGHGCGCKDHGSAPSFEQGQASSQSQSGSNSVSQYADSKAISKPGPQLNLNAPIRLLDDHSCGCDRGNGKHKGKGKHKGGKSPCGCKDGNGPSNGGDVTQSNASTADSSASNKNWSWQGLDQEQADTQRQNGLQRL